MENINQRIENLENSFKQLNVEQIRTTETLNAVLTELQSLKASLQKDAASPQTEVPFVRRSTSFVPPAKKQVPTATNSFRKDQLENLIGSNIINKIGILVTVVGVFIGAKYAIEKELISATTRIILGYSVAAVLCLLAYRLKAKYIDYSAVLMSGSISIIYFITYIAHSFYHLFPQPVAFGLMLFTTAFVVSMSIWYNRKIIALLGQVGAYAIPFLLSTGNENLPLLYGYLSIINIGLLFLSFKRDWKLIYEFAFGFSWFIFAFSFLNAKNLATGFSSNIIFLLVNFIIFYTAFLVNKIFKKELYALTEISILLINAVAFFLLGYYLINNAFDNEHYLTLFTLGNALIHLVIGERIKWLKLADESVTLFILGLGLTFFTVSIPIHFEGNTITVLWAIEAVFLCYTGLTKKREAYLILSIALLFLTLGSLLIDWKQDYATDTTISIATKSFLNANFLSSLFVCICFGVISSLSIKHSIDKQGLVKSVLTVAVPLAFILLTYGCIVQEIDLAWTVYMINHASEALNSFKLLSLQGFSIGYLSFWLWLNWQYFKEKHLATILAIVGLYALFIAVIGGLPEIGILRDLYIKNKSVNIISMLGIRYGYFMLIAALVLGIASNLKTFLASANITKLIALVFNSTLLVLLCNEFIHWMDIGGYSKQYKLGLSIIFAVYALALIITGIRKKLKHIRMGGIILFGITLCKVLFYDLSSLPTISKTVVLIVLGVIMLIASFLYNKFKDSIFGNEAETIVDKS
ncbi:MAG: DUF2339 domain-containing protein [Chitinophagaceae bacterium]|nr:DUF2339 domain-containing protein [Chitinophagaceae bacterium]